MFFFFKNPTQNKIDGKTGNKRLCFWFLLITDTVMTFRGRDGVFSKTMSQYVWVYKRAHLATFLLRLLTASKSDWDESQHLHQASLSGSTWYMIDAVCPLILGQRAQPDWLHWARLLFLWIKFISSWLLPWIFSVLITGTFCCPISRLVCLWMTDAAQHQDNDVA